MTCNECRQQLVLAEGEKEAPEAVRHHLTGCGACQDFVREDGQLRAQVRKVADGERAPRALGDRIEEIVQGQRVVGGRPRRNRLGAAAAVAFLALGSFGLKWYYSERMVSSERLAQEFIADHLHYLPGREEIVSESARDVEKWFAGRVDFPVLVPAVPAASLEDGRVCTIGGRKAALLHYRRKPNDTLVSLFIAPAPQKLAREENSAALSASYRGCNAVLWCRRGLVYSLVAALGEVPLRDIAVSLRQQQP